LSDEQHDSGSVYEPVTAEQESCIAELAFAGGEPVSPGRWPASLSRQGADELIASLEDEVRIRAQRLRCQAQIRDLICSWTLERLREMRDRCAGDLQDLDGLLSRLDSAESGQVFDLCREEVTRVFGALADAVRDYREQAAP
jgi:hypothetical protein